MKNKFYTLHLHCAIGPRRDPWLGSPDADPSIGPYRDSYFRAYHTCYGPNTSAAFRDETGLVADLRNNFRNVSFDVSPELMAWLQEYRPRVYSKILEADRLQRREFGHGGALAVPHPPLILPLANRADKRTAIRWGIADFRARFGRPPEGMWLPENAVDDETCEVLLEEEIRFTVVARTQAARVRPLGGDSDSWTEVLPERLDPRRPYRWLSREHPGRWLGIFAVRGDLSPRRMLARNAAADDDAVAVDACQGFANKLVDSLTANESAELAHLAMDAEEFGLVHAYGERALAYTLDILEREAPARRTNYAAFLDLFPPPQEIDLKPVSARSCSHGLERWRGICECRNPEAPERSVAWRAPLRDALEQAARGAGEAVESLISGLTRTPLPSLDQGFPILFSNKSSDVEAFLAAAARRHPTPAEAQKLVRALEIRRASLASLGHWTWQGIDGSSREVVQALLEIARALDVLALERPERAAELEVQLQEALGQVPLEENSNASELYRSLIRPRRVDAKSAAVHAALDACVRERVPGLPSLDAPNWRTTLRLICRRDRPQRGGPGTSLRVFEVSARDLKTYSSISALAAVLDLGRASFECRLGSNDAPEAAAASLERAFVEGGPEGFAAAAGEMLGAQSWGLDGLLGETRRAAIKELTARRGPDPDTDEVRARWDCLLSSLDRAPSDSDLVAKVLAESAPIANDLDAVHGVDRVRDALAAHAAKFAESPSEETLAPMVRLIRAAREAHFPFNVWEIRDLGRSGLSRMKGTAPENDKKALLSLLGLAEKSLAGEDRWSHAN